MNMNNSRMFAFFGDSYYRVHEDLPIVIPSNVDYKSTATNSQVIDSMDLGTIDVYAYHTDLLTERNSERVACMKEMLIGDKVEKIEDINNDYVVGVAYELYNKDGQLLKSGTTSVKAIYHTAIIASDVSEENNMEYRKAMLFDGKIEIQIPEISRYGIKNKYVQHPFTVRITSVTVSSTIGENYFCGEETTQLTSEKLFSATHAHIIHRREPHLGKNNFASHFITNAHVGTTIIDQTVVPAILEVDKEYTLIPLCTVECDKNSNVAKFNHKLKSIEVNVEVLVDNSNVVFDLNDIREIIKLNYEEAHPPIEPVEPPTEEEPGEGDKPSEGDNGEDEPTDPPTGDNTGEDNNDPTNPPIEGGDDNGGDNPDEGGGTEPTEPPVGEDTAKDEPGSSEDNPSDVSGESGEKEETPSENTQPVEEESKTEETNNSEDEIKDDTL